MDKRGMTAREEAATAISSALLAIGCTLTPWEAVGRGVLTLDEFMACLAYYERVEALDGVA